jgi:hypothetical protein
MAQHIADSQVVSTDRRDVPLEKDRERILRRHRVDTDFNLSQKRQETHAGSRRFAGA